MPHNFYSFDLLICLSLYYYILIEIIFIFPTHCFFYCSGPYLKPLTLKRRHDRCYISAFLGLWGSGFCLCALVWIPPPPLSLLALAMSVAPRTICYAGSWDQVGVCHSQARSFTVVGCLSPSDTTSRGKQHDTDHGRLPHTEGMYRGHRSYVALICSNVTLISRQDGQADGICYSGVIPLSVMQQLLMLCWR